MKHILLIILSSFSFFSFAGTSTYENIGPNSQGTHWDGSKSNSQTLGDTTIVEHYGKKGKYVRKGMYTTYTDEDGNKTVYHHLKNKIYGKAPNGIEIEITWDGDKTFIKRNDGKSVTCTTKETFTTCVDE